MPKSRRAARLGETEEMVRLYTEGDETGRLSVRQVAERLGLSRWVVATRLHEMGVKLRERDTALRAMLDRLEAKREREERNRCPIQNCREQRQAPDRACYYHEKLVRGLMAPAPATSLGGHDRTARRKGRPAGSRGRRIKPKAQM